MHAITLKLRSSEQRTERLIRSIRLKSFIIILACTSSLKCRIFKEKRIKQIMKQLRRSKNYLLRLLSSLRKRQWHQKEEAALLQKIVLEAVLLEEEMQVLSETLLVVPMKRLQGLEDQALRRLVVHSF